MESEDSENYVKYIKILSILEIGRKLADENIVKINY